MRMNQNFDHVGWGILSLVEISTTEGWVDVTAVAITGFKVEEINY